MAILNGIPLFGIYFFGNRGVFMRDTQFIYGGAHTYERVDKPRGQFFHTNWTGGRGGDVSSTNYSI